MFENKRLIKLANGNDEIVQVIQKNYMSIYKYCYWIGCKPQPQAIAEVSLLSYRSSQEEC